MVERSDEPGPTIQSRSSIRIAHASRNLFGAGSQRPHALNDTPSQNGQHRTVPGGPRVSSSVPHGDTITIDAAPSQDFSEKPGPNPIPPAPPPTENVHGEEPSAIEAAEKPNILTRFYRVCKGILLASWMNTLLVFVPVGIAVQVAGVSPTIIFAMNAIAIIPLAGLLSFATESVASEMGDTIGALMNVTFGNAVELIIL